MFTIIYDLNTKLVRNIVEGQSSEEEIGNAIDRTANGIIYASTLPQITDIYRKELKVIDGKVLEVNKVLTAEQEKEIRRFEINNEISQLKFELTSGDYKTMKWVEGKLSDTEYREHCHARQLIRDKINALEAELAELNK